MRRHTLLATLALSLTQSRGVGAAAIYISWSVDGSGCATTQPENTLGTMYVYASLGAPIPSVEGMTGAEFRVVDFPEGWPATPVPNPAANLVIGNPLAGGCNIGFPDCQSGTSFGHVTLFAVNYFATSTVTDHRVMTTQHSAPNNPNFPCPLLVLCDSPVFTTLCVQGGIGIINGPDPCIDAVEPSTWSHIKSIYRSVSAH